MKHAGRVMAAMLAGWLMMAASGVSANETGATQSPVQSADTFSSAEYGFSITKPSGWFLFTEPALLEKGFIGLVVEESEQVEAPKGLVLITRFPLETSWASFSPRVEVDVYQLKKMTPDRRDINRLVLDDLLLAVRENPDMETQIVAPPTDIEINGKPWRKVVLNAKMPMPANDERSQDVMRVYVECYVHAVQEKLFLIQLVARPVDMPSYRPLLNEIVKSITVDNAGIQAPMLTYSALQSHDGVDGH